MRFCWNQPAILSQFAGSLVRKVHVLISTLSGMILQTARCVYTSDLNKSHLYVSCQIEDKYILCMFIICFNYISCLSWVQCLYKSSTIICFTSVCRGRIVNKATCRKKLFFTNNGDCAQFSCMKHVSRSPFLACVAMRSFKKSCILPFKFKKNNYPLQSSFSRPGTKQKKADMTSVVFILASLNFYQ